MFNGFSREAALWTFDAATTSNPAWRRDAAEALRAEARKTSTPLRLVARQVEPVGDAGEGLFRLHTAAHAPFDWTWEGAAAYQLRDPDDPTDRTWSGEVVQVDEDRGQIYLSLTFGALCEGPFWIRPFGFLDALVALFRQSERAPATAQGLDVALLASLGRGPKATTSGESTSWHHPWGILWGPPGTGKTYSIGRQVARVLRRDDERILVVSTTNRATDAAALHIADALRDRGLPLDLVRRVGAAASLHRFEARGAAELVAGAEAFGRRQLARLLEARRTHSDPEARARLTVQLNATRQAIREAAGAFLDPRHRVVVCTAFHALQKTVDAQIAALRSAQRAPFTTVVIDEAGLTNRAVTAALAQLAARRVWLVGDPRQLAPIARVARVLPSSQARWLASSGLSHLDPAKPVPPNVDVLTVQHRMGPAIRKVVSHYAYEGRLTDADSVLHRTFAADGRLLAEPRALWYVLDEDTGGRLADIRAERGPGHRSWVRRRTQAVLQRFLQAHPALAQHRALVMTPFKAQARALDRWLSERGLATWEACTVHAQQGAEAPLVFFDPVNAGSTAWGPAEWRRLVNVALSRAQHQLVVLASRLEMQEPYLRPLADHLAPRVLEGHGTSWTYRAVPGVSGPIETLVAAEAPLGAQFAARRTLKPVLSREQERLCAMPLDGRPRLVRGVAGSGKTWVLGHWLARTLRENGTGRAFVVFANRALQGLLASIITEAWSELEPTRPLPVERFVLWHIRDLLDELLVEEGLPPVEGYDFDAATTTYLAAVPDWANRPRCASLFVDEAQDLGPMTLRLLTGLVRPATPRATQRPIHIFYDNAQDLYGRGMPRWSDLGIAIRGRTTVLQESFRGTRPIAEFALNTLGQLVDLDRDPDHRELLERGLVWQDDGVLRVGFNQSDGPRPTFAVFDDRIDECEALGDQILEWLQREAIRPCDIRVLANSSEVREAVVDHLAPRLAPLGVVVEAQARQTLSTDARTLVVTTAHSFKGHEAEIIAVPGADRFVARRSASPLLARALYVALTRARSILYVSARTPVDEVGAAASSRIITALRRAHAIPASSLIASDLHLVERVPTEHRTWFRKLARQFRVTDEPIRDRHGSIVAQPLFVVRDGERRLACFGQAVPRAVVADLEDHGVELIELGARSFA
ncbi:MAG: AAA domain-containing protein [Myxococcota bacterium]